MVTMFFNEKRKKGEMIYEKVKKGEDILITSKGFLIKYNLQMFDKVVKFNNRKTTNKTSDFS